MTGKQIFISHATSDATTAYAVCKFLEELHWRCWIAPRNIAAGTDWANAIAVGIERSNVLVILLSRKANASKHVQREVHIADNHGIPIIPINIDGCPPSGSLAFFAISTQHIDAFPGPIETHLDRVAEALNGAPLDRQVVRNALAAVKAAMPALIAAQRQTLLQLWHSIAYRLAAHRELLNLEAALTERALELADAKIEQAGRNGRKVLPRLFHLAWPVAARTEASVLFFFFALLSAGPIIQAVGGAIADTTRAAGRRDAVETIALAIGMPGWLVDVVIGAASVAVPYLCCLIMVDRLLALPKGIAIVSVGVSCVWAAVAAALTPAHPYGAHSTLDSPELMATLAFAASFLLHLKAIWKGIWDVGFYGKCLRYRRLVQRR